MSIFDEIAGIVLENLGDSGVGALGSVTYTTVTPGTYVPTSGVGAGTTSALPDVPAVIEDYRGVEALADGVRVGDKKVSIFAESLAGVPSLSDRITVGGLPYGIEAIREVEAGGVIIQYVFQCRRG